MLLKYCEIPKHKFKQPSSPPPPPPPPGLRAAQVWQTGGLQCWSLPWGQGGQERSTMCPGPMVHSPSHVQRARTHSGERMLLITLNLQLFFSPVFVEISLNGKKSRILICIDWRKRFSKPYSGFLRFLCSF